MVEGRRAHRHTAPRRGSSTLVALAGLGTGVIAAGLAWYYLVHAAIDFGGLAASGQALAWLVAFGAAAGALACLGVMLALVGRGLRTLGFLSDRTPSLRAGARRRR